MHHPRLIHWKGAIFVLGMLFGILWYAADLRAATLSLSPAAGTFTVGSTLDVSVLLNTEGATVNAVELALQFPPDQLQVVSPSIGASIFSLWVSQPQVNNREGTVLLQGGIPSGINVSSGLVTTITFRVKSVGGAVVRVLDRSKVLLHDGIGTDALRSTQGGVYQLALPPPGGPAVSSETHPDQSRWYPNATINLSWAPEAAVDGYSYILDEEPGTTPDDISEGTDTGVVYRQVGDGTKYFHIKALKNERWGGVTHFSIRVDTVPPAEFPLEILPSARTTNRRPIVQFATTDALSGLDHHELKLIPLTGGGAGELQTLFIEATSPYVVSELELGSYDVIVRAYDAAGNFRESAARLRIVEPLYRFLGERGIELFGTFTLPWVVLWIILGILLVLLAFLVYRVTRWHHRVDVRRLAKDAPPDLRRKLMEYEKYFARHGKELLVVFCMVGASLLGGVSGTSAHGGDTRELSLAPPVISSVAQHISNDELFYLGGVVDAPGVEVVLYIQNLEDGTTQSARVAADRRGQWFYNHDTFLPSGNYLVWAQSVLGEEASPPSPQVTVTVRQTAIHFGASRVSYEVLYGILTLILLLAALVLTGVILYHVYHGRRKHARFTKEVREAEDAVQSGFLKLRNALEAELAVVKKAKMSRTLAAHEREREAELTQDLEQIERHIIKEVHDIIDVERGAHRA